MDEEVGNMDNPLLSLNASDEDDAGHNGSQSSSNCCHRRWPKLWTHLKHWVHPVLTVVAVITVAALLEHQSTEAAQLKDELSTLRTNLQDTRDEYNELKGELASLSGELTTLKQLAKDIGTLNQTVQNAQGLVQEVDDKVIQWNQTIIAANETIEKRLESFNDTANQFLGEFQNEIDGFEQTANQTIASEMTKRSVLSRLPESDDESKTQILTSDVVWIRNWTTNGVWKDFGDEVQVNLPDSGQLVVDGDMTMLIRSFHPTGEKVTYYGNPIIVALRVDGIRMNNVCELSMLGSGYGRALVLQSGEFVGYHGVNFHCRLHSDGTTPLTNGAHNISISISSFPQLSSVTEVQIHGTSAPGGLGAGDGFRNLRWMFRYLQL